jgi:predicted Zn-dependent peptidase
MPARLARVTRAELGRFAERLTRDRATVGWFVPAEAVAAPATPAAPGDASAATGGTPGVNAAPPPAAEARVAAASAPVSFRLPNGLDVRLAPTGAGALVSLRGRIEAGALFDGPTPGLSALATELLARAVPGEAPAAAPLSFTLHDDPESPALQRWIEFAASSLASDLPDVLRDLAARLRRGADFAAGARLPPADWDAIRPAAAHRARTNAAATSTALWARALAELFAAPSPLRTPVWGVPAAIEAAREDALRAFLRRHVHPRTTTVVLSGGLDAPAARREVEAHLGPLSGGAETAAVPSLPGARTGAQWRVIRLPRPGKSQDEVRVVVPGDRARPADETATALLLYLLGETGYAGRLGRALVDPGLVYSVYATREEEGAPGFLMVRTAAAPRDTPEVLRRIREILETAAAGRFTAAELREAQAYLRGKDARAREGSAAAARDLLEGSERGPRGDPAAVSLDQLNDTARRLFRNGAPVAIVAGPPEG